jgi:hypothetical protein
VSSLDHFEQIAHRGFFRPVGAVAFDQAVELVASAMVTARSRGCVDLLVNLCGFTGLAPPTIFARYGVAVRWAESAGGKLRVAMVAPAAFIDPDKIGVLMVQNRGLTAEVFTSEVAAIAWLDAHLATDR